MKNGVTANERLLIVRGDQERHVSRRMPRRGNSHDFPCKSLPILQQFKHAKRFERGEHVVYIGRDAHLHRRELIEIPFVLVQHVAGIREQRHTLRSKVPANVVAMRMS